MTQKNWESAAKPMKANVFCLSLYSLVSVPISSVLGSTSIITNILARKPRQLTDRVNIHMIFTFLFVTKQGCLQASGYLYKPLAANAILL